MTEQQILDMSFEQLRDALRRSALSHQLAVPEGFKLVPVEPTIEMVAALGFEGDADIAIGHAHAFKETVNAYAAMLAAAPTPLAPSAESPAVLTDDLRKLIEAAAKCISDAVAWEQDGFDSPPMPATEWDYNADQLAYALRAEIERIDRKGDEQE